MPKISIICGSLLILIGVAGYVMGMSSGNVSITALIPAFFGIVMAVLGAAANAKPDISKHLMHGSIVVALLGFIAVAVRLIPRLSGLDLSSPAVLSQLSMGAICLVFVILAIRSFASARTSQN